MDGSACQDRHVAPEGPPEADPVEAHGAERSPHAAFLRVYQPLETFPADERAWWRHCVAEHRTLDRTHGPARERAAVLAAIATGRMVPDIETRSGEDSADLGDAYVLESGGVLHVCPVDLRSRCWVALAQFRQGMPEPVAEAFVPRPVLDEGDRVIARSRLHRMTVPTILTNAWHVPLRWFILVDPSDRVLVLVPGTRSLRFVAPMTQARQRLARALAVLRRTIDDPTTIAGVEDLGRWLEEWHPRSLVELDYAGLVTLMDDATLRDDHTPEDLGEALAALAGGDGPAAVAAYERATVRWRRWGALENAS